MDLKQYREINNITQIDLANKIGVSSSSISQYERGTITDNAVKRLIDNYLEQNTKQDESITIISSEYNSEVQQLTFNEYSEIELTQIKYIDLLASELLKAKDMDSKKAIIDRLNKTIEVF
ncbi:helix-turn-helix transcriptional regulator [Gemella sp. GH3]|uniref:helix-turn-helix domain-containing protein n=1 Tax=unclassified Gemella TaxID=2624949 RepID=UPI0015D0C94D|nr:MULTISPECIES: helix-turn-helix transcriptional regulator [unclassified Gemella]MBF0713540.1 helix-turn-helix transcriptional regulator [Gemella sp. GH3.1]NYS50492.1 helix-turn-helix transcriptional regulator [Gemella sp. GH3]